MSTPTLWGGDINTSSNSHLTLETITLMKGLINKKKNKFLDIIVNIIYLPDLLMKTVQYVPFNVHHNQYK